MFTSIFSTWQSRRSRLKHDARSSLQIDYTKTSWYIGNEVERGSIVYLTASMSPFLLLRLQYVLRDREGRSDGTSFNRPIIKLIGRGLVNPRFIVQKPTSLSSYKSCASWNKFSCLSTSSLIFELELIRIYENRTSHVRLLSLSAMFVFTVSSTYSMTPDGTSNVFKLS